VTGASHRERRVPSNKRMKLSKPGDLGGSWLAWSGIIESGVAAYAQCSPLTPNATKLARFSVVEAR
jgi:hypothetical protein